MIIIKISDQRNQAYKRGKILKKLRTKNGITQKQLADNLEVSYETVAKWENGLSLPSVPNLKKLSAFYKVTIDVLLALVDISKDFDEKVLDIRKIKENLIITENKTSSKSNKRGG